MCVKEIFIEPATYVNKLDLTFESYKGTPKSVIMAQKTFEKLSLSTTAAHKSNTGKVNYSLLVLSILISTIADVYKQRKNAVLSLPAGMFTLTARPRVDLISV